MPKPSENSEASRGVEMEPGGAPAPDRFGGTDPLRSAAAVLLCGLFFVLLWMPMLDWALGLDHTSAPVENRVPAGFPALGSGVAGLKKYVAGLEACFNDHFGFRKLLIRTHARYEHKWFGKGNTQVAMGENQWLYFTGDGALENYLGLRPLSPQKLADWKRLLERRRDWLAARGMAYLFVVPPNKETIYPEFMPKSVSKPGAQTELDQLAAYLKTNSTVELLDLRAPLREAKKSACVYQATDSHWNYLGAFVACQEIIRALGRRLPGMEPLPLAAFDIIHTNKTGGDLAVMLAQEQTLREPDFVTLRPRPPLPALELRSEPALLAGNWPPGQEPKVGENPEKSCKVVMFRDSFTFYLTPFLGYHFKRIVYIWDRAWDTALIERERPDVVIDEVVERFLDNPLPAE